MGRIVEIKLSDKQLIEEFSEDCKLQGLAKETIRNYKSQLKIFSQFLKRTNRDF